MGRAWLGSFSPFLVPLSNDKRLRMLRLRRSVSTGWPLHMQGPLSLPRSKVRGLLAQKLQTNPSTEDSAPPCLEITQQRPHPT